MKYLIIGVVLGAAVGCDSGTGTTYDPDTALPSATRSGAPPVTQESESFTNPMDTPNTGVDVNRSTDAPGTGAGAARTGVGAAGTGPVMSDPGVDASNTGVNVRDRESTAKTAFDQNENTADIEITSEIRKRITDTEMSVNARNVKIITQGGRVTLRGPVQTMQEKQSIEEFAAAVAGADKVDNQLDVQQP